MVFGSNAVWRYSQQREHYSICDGVDLGPGIVVTGPRGDVSLSNDAFYTATCFNGAPVYSTFRRVGASTIPLMDAQWAQFVQTETGSFKYSVYPIIYSITVSFVMCLFLTVIVFTNHTQKPSWLLRIGSFLASVNLFVLFVRAVVYLSRQYSDGFSSGEKLLQDIQNDNVFNVIDFVFVLIAQFAQVQVIIRLFSRVKEKRVSFILGGLLSISAQVIWGVSTFVNFDQEEDSDISILPAFTYLLRIALSMMYTGLILIYSFWRRNYIFHSRIILLTVLTVLVVNLQAAFFIVDIANVWVSELSEVFNTTIYVSATVIPWEWINRVHVLQRHNQYEGVLGRPVYEDEYVGIMKYEIMDDDSVIDPPDNNNNNNNDNNNNDNDNDDNNNNNDNTGIGGNTGLNENTEERSSPQIAKRIKSSLAHTTNAFWYFTDQVISYGLAIPRSVSVSTESQAGGRNSAGGLGISGLPLSRKGKNKTKKTGKKEGRKDVFVYSQKQVVCDSDNEG